MAPRGFVYSSVPDALRWRQWDVWCDAWETCDQRHSRCRVRGAPARQLQLLLWPSLAPGYVHAAEYTGGEGKGGG
eukprot:5154596-Lingulodinium_polyedra.AAC.1